MAKDKNKRLRYGAIFWNITKKSKILYMFGMFVILYFVFTGLIYFFDKNAFNNFGDALWFTFVSFTTVGYGDLNVATPMSRIFTAILVIYGTVIIAIFTAIWANLISEVMKSRLSNNEEDDNLDKLADLEHLSKEELIELSAKFKHIKEKRFNFKKIKEADNIQTSEEKPPLTTEINITTEENETK